MKFCYNIIIWGTGKLYNDSLNLIKFMELRGDIKIIGITSNDKNIKHMLDGYPFIKKTDITKSEYDYCLVAVNNFNEVRIEAAERGIVSSRLIPIRVLAIPYFDFNKYIAIKESNLSILSRNCWAGVLYHYLGLEFLSPTINMFFEAGDFNKFIDNLDEYLSLPVEFKKMRYEKNLKVNYPVGRINRVGGGIDLHFNHYTNFKDAKSCWERRKTRINKKNLLIISSTIFEDEAKDFDSIKYRNKLIFVPFESKLNSSFKIEYEKNQDNLTIGMVCNGIANGTLSVIDLLSFLNHEDNYVRTCN